MGTPDFITPLELLPGSHYPPAPLLLIFLLIRTDSLLLVLLLFQHPREWEGLGGTPRSPQTHFLLPTVPSPTTPQDFSEEMRMLKAARGTHLLGDLGLCVGLALVLILGHLLRHGPANGFLKLLERFLQTPTLLRASPVMSLVYTSLFTLRTHSKHNQPQGGSAAAAVAPVSMLSPSPPGPEATGLPCKVTHLLTQVQFSCTLDQGVFAAGQEGSQVGIHSRTGLAAQLPGLCLYAEEQSRVTHRSTSHLQEPRVGQALSHQSHNIMERPAQQTRRTWLGRMHQGSQVKDKTESKVSRKLSLQEHKL